MLEILSPCAGSIQESGGELGAFPVCQQQHVALLNPNLAVPVELWQQWFGKSCDWRLGLSLP